MTCRATRWCLLCSLLLLACTSGASDATQTGLPSLDNRLGPQAGIPVGCRMPDERDAADMLRFLGIAVSPERNQRFYSLTSRWYDSIAALPTPPTTCADTASWICASSRSAAAAKGLRFDAEVCRDGVLGMYKTNDVGCAGLFRAAVRRVDELLADLKAKGELRQDQEPSPGYCYVALFVAPLIKSIEQSSGATAEQLGRFH